MYEEMGECLEQVEENQLLGKLKTLLAETQQTSLQKRVQRAIAEIKLAQKARKHDAD
jgi:hypothetical protein